MKKHDIDIVNAPVKDSIQCEIYLKHMRKDNLKRHIKQHEKKSTSKEQNFLNDITSEMQEFSRKTEIGRKIREIMDRNPQFNENAL